MCESVFVTALFKYLFVHSKYAMAFGFLYRFIRTNEMVFIRNALLFRHNEFHFQMNAANEFYFKKLELYEAQLISIFFLLLKVTSFSSIEFVMLTSKECSQEIWLFILDFFSHLSWKCLPDIMPVRTTRSTYLNDILSYWHIS